MQKAFHDLCRQVERQQEQAVDELGVQVRPQEKQWWQPVEAMNVTLPTALQQQKQLNAEEED